MPSALVGFGVAATASVIFVIRLAASPEPVPIFISVVLLSLAAILLLCLAGGLYLLPFQARLIELRRSQGVELAYMARRELETEGSLALIRRSTREDLSVEKAMLGQYFFIVMRRDSLSVESRAGKPAFVRVAREFVVGARVGSLESSEGKHEALTVLIDTGSLNPTVVPLLISGSRFLGAYSARHDELTLTAELTSRWANAEE